MGKTNEFTLVAEGKFAGELGCAVVVDAKLIQSTPVGKVATAGEAIDGIVTDITAGANEVLAVAKVGDIAFVKLGGAVTVGDELEVAEGGKLVTKDSGVAVAKALATGVADERIPAIIK